MIDNIFTELHPHLRGVKKADNYYVVEVNLKHSWLIPRHSDIQTQSNKKINDMTYSMFYSDKLGFDSIIEWLKTDVIKMNIELEQKENLLKSKVEQLKEIFENSSLEELQKMDFGTGREKPLKLGNKLNKSGKTVEDKIDIEDEKTVEV